jgi:hypothetical protein
VRTIDVRIDVTEAVAIGERVENAATVCLPESLPDAPVVCFAFPGGGYSRHYFTFDMPGSSGGGQAGWHTDRGWVFVACDHVHVGDSTLPADPTLLTFDNLAVANRATVTGVLARLASGTLADDLAPVAPGFTVGIGQSMGGCLLIVQQGQHHTFDAIAVLGFSGRRTRLWMPPGAPEMNVPYIPRGGTVVVISAATAVEQTPAMAVADDGLPGTAPGFHYDDEPRDVVAADMVDYPERRRPVPVWASTTIPPCAVTMLAPGAVAPEAASIVAPVLAAFGERDVSPDPLAEPAAYLRATDVSVFVCPRMAHMHNFAGTRQLFWDRIHGWAESARRTRDLTRDLTQPSS